MTGVLASGSGSFVPQGETQSVSFLFSLKTRINSTGATQIQRWKASITAPGFSLDVPGNAKQGVNIGVAPNFLSAVSVISLSAGTFTNLGNTLRNVVVSSSDATLTDATHTKAPCIVILSVYDSNLAGFADALEVQVFLASDPGSLYRQITSGTALALVPFGTASPAPGQITPATVGSPAPGLPETSIDVGFTDIPTP
jgi:hypothetical protein